MGKKKQNSISSVSKAKKEFKQRMANANVSNKVTKATNKLKSTKPVLKNLKKIVNETRGKVSSTNYDFEKLQTQIYSASAKTETVLPMEKKRDSFEMLRTTKEDASQTDIDAALAQFSNFYPMAAKN